LELAELLRFPCSNGKRPLIAGGFYGARRDWLDDSAFPLVGVRTGSANGFDCVDIDPEGQDWYRLNFDALPTTRAHSTPRGLHLFFRHVEGLRSSTGRIAKGVDVRAENAYVIFWPREGLPFEDWPICEWPTWLLRLAISTNAALGQGQASMNVVMDGPLGQLDVTHYRNYGDWLRLMMACRVAGSDRGDWIEWCVSDPMYADDAAEIERLWDTLKVDRITGWALRVEIRLAQLRNGICPKHTMPGALSEVHIGGDPDYQVQRRVSSILQIARRDEPGAFWASCVMREIISQGRINPRVAVELLCSAGVDRRVIAAGFLCVEDKLEDGERNGQLPLPD
jgi:hypothetical protein